MSIPFLNARITEDTDFLRLKEFAMFHEDWHLEYDRQGIKIWSKAVPDATVKMIKVSAIFSGINSLDLYHTLLDPIYRKEWDTHMIVAYDIGYLNENNGISYYAASCPPPLRNRDFVLQNSWFNMGSEHFTLNHSVCHKDHPPRQGFIRAVSYFTGYYIKAVLDNGCEMTFVTQTDPQGFIPSWIVNKCTQILAPRYVRQIEKAACGYKAWKSQNSPNFFPWVHSDQMKTPKISVEDCVPSAEEMESHFFRGLINKLAKLKVDDATPHNKEHVRHQQTPIPLKSSVPSDGKAGPSKIPLGNYDSNAFHISPQNNKHVTEIDNKGKRKKSSVFHIKMKKLYNNRMTN